MEEIQQDMKKLLQDKEARFSDLLFLFQLPSSSDDGYNKMSASLGFAKFSLNVAKAEAVLLHGGFNGTENSHSARNSATNLTGLSGDLNGNDVGMANNGENSYMMQ